MGKRERFLKTYANLPINTRNEIIYILPDPDNRPLTWNAVFIEVNNNTKLSEQILDSLDELGFI
jgi:hypothetical protein